MSASVYTMGGMIPNTILYLFMQNFKKTPIARGDIVANAMNNQHTSFAEVMANISEILEKSFGIELTGVGQKSGRCSYGNYILMKFKCFEDMIWTVLERLQLSKAICKQRQNLRCILNQEYVSTLLLKPEESSSGQYRYDWGLRAEKEISKPSVLKFVTELFPGKQPYGFPAQQSIDMGAQNKDSTEGE
ncbi:unnamed protein product, partial [Allacma fusca]